MTKEVFIFSDIYLPTFPYLEIPLYNELNSRKIKTSYVLQEGDIRLTDPVLSKVFLNLKNLVVVKKPKHVAGLMEKGDLYISRFAYKLTAGDVAAKVRSKGHKILMYDPSGIDIRVRACPAQYLTAKSESLKKLTLKKFPKQYKGVFATGTIHYDAAAITSVDRESFMKSYCLDPNKKLAVITPASPGEAWMKGIQDDYKSIVRIMKEKCPGYEIVIKCHPMDYLAHMKPQPGIVHKNQHYGGKHSWEVIAPDLTVIKADEGYMALKACDVVLNIRSSIAMETSLFCKPLININRKKYVTNWLFDQNTMIDIDIEDLSSVLNANNYESNKEAYLNYIKKEAHSADGKAYVRTADLAVMILKNVHQS